MSVVVPGPQERVLDVWSWSYRDYRLSTKKIMWFFSLWLITEYLIIIQFSCVWAFFLWEAVVYIYFLICCICLDWGLNATVNRLPGQVGRLLPSRVSESKGLAFLPYPHEKIALELGRWPTRPSTGEAGVAQAEITCPESFSEGWGHGSAVRTLACLSAHAKCLFLYLPTFLVFFLFFSLSFFLLSLCV